MELLNDMALFVEVVKAKSFRGAAEANGIPNSTLSRRISILEREIGLRLLHRTTRKIELTEAGQIYYEHSKRIVEEARLAHKHLGEMLAQPSGILRISLTEGFGTNYLAPLLAQFAQLYPKIQFELDLSSHLADLIAEPIDVAIRMGELPDSSLIAFQLARLPRRLYASPRYLDLAGVPKSPSELSQHECLLLRTSKPESWQLFKDEESVDVASKGRFLLNNVNMIQKLAISHMGIAMLDDVVVREALAAGSLRQILPDWQAPPISIYAITETRLLPAKVKLFIEFLRENLHKNSLLEIAIK
ncbi:LysR family transcriptional regulator [Acinetobacter sp. 3657]|uniref:LysR family transcriptional regulator n=1 Tax=Acinetobacter sp. 3657 TaxID=2817764 RepID=UPI002854B199|nr:DNA-binding transcriptional LysR family regulator [Prolinoborus sp. 3657]